MADVVDISTRRRVPPDHVSGGYRVVVYAPDGSMALDVSSVEGAFFVLPAPGECREVDAALVRARDLLDDVEWR